VTASGTEKSGERSPPAKRLENWVGFLVALAFGARAELHPFHLKSIACLHLVVGAPLLHLFRAAFVLALSRDTELRYGIRDGDGVQRSQDNNR